MNGCAKKRKKPAELFGSRAWDIQHLNDVMN